MSETDVSTDTSVRQCVRQTSYTDVSQTVSETDVYTGKSDSE